MAFFDLPAGSAALKEWYDDQKVENLAYDENPTLAMVPKKTKATGKYVPQPIIYEVSQGRSSIFANAQANQTAPLLAEFMMPLRPDYGIATLTNQALEASGDDKGAFLEFATMFVDVTLQGLALSAASSMFRAGTGSIGQVSTILAGVITLSNAADVSQFGLNQTLQASSTDGGSPRAALGYVVGRNVIAGTITVSATALGGAAGTPTGWTANDFLLVQGDSNAKYTGFAAWLPAVAPGAGDNFYGTNRSNESRLYGLAYPGTTQPIEEALIDAAMLVRREKGNPKHIFTNFGSFAALDKALNARRTFVDWTGDAEISFRGLRLNGPSGPIDVFADRNCQAATAWLLQLPTWTLYSLGQVPKISETDGMRILRSPNADACEVRCVSYAQLGCRAPGWNSQIALSV